MISKKVISMIKVPMKDVRKIEKIVEDYCPAFQLAILSTAFFRNVKPLGVSYEDVMLHLKELWDQIPDKEEREKLDLFFESLSDED